MTAHFIKCAAREKRSPTCLNCGQFVEDKTTENKTDKMVIPLFLQTQQTISNSSPKKSYLSVTFSFNPCFPDRFTLTCITVTNKTLFTRTRVGAKRVLAVCVDVTNWWRLQALIFI